MDRPRPAPLDIKALLSVALDREPRDDVQERVLDRVALSATALELARLFFLAPVHWLVADSDADPSHDDPQPPSPRS